MKNIKNNIDKQIECNKGKNLFNINSASSMLFNSDTINAIENLGLISKENENILIDYSTEKCLQEFCRINQYFSYSKEAKQILREIYVELFSSAKAKGEPIDVISSRHYKKLKDWLIFTNPSSEKEYRNSEEIIQPIICEEYSAEFQIELLQIDISQIMEPVLDIGCGKHGNIVNYLRSKEIEAYGIDRFAKSNSFTRNENWLEYNYGTSKWGTIISNLGFSNHFSHQHLRNDGDFIGYAKKYMEILNSLKIEGSFFYAPSLPFIEKYLNSDIFKIINRKMQYYNLETAIVTRIK